MNSLMSPNLRLQSEELTTTDPEPNPLNSNNILPDSVRLPTQTAATYINHLVTAHIFPSLAGHFLLGNRNTLNLNIKRPFYTSAQPIASFPDHPVPTSVSYSLPFPHEIEETGELVYSIVEGEKVMGFNVWGEVRLCLPHLLRFVLNDVHIDEIGQAITKFHISCAKCSPRQLAMLHECNALPNEVTSCGLIRKSDAEHMLKFLRSTRQRPTLADACPRVDPDSGWGFVSGQSSSPRKSDSGVLGTYIDVRHDCFGRQRGRVYPNLYTSASSPCILCRTCDKLFSPQDFVGHTHKPNESESCCHWGFDSTNWRSYLQLDIDPNNPHKKSKRELDDDSEIKMSDACIYRALKDFKLKFLEPLVLPKEITDEFSKFGVLNCDTKSPQSPMESQPLDCSTSAVPSPHSPMNGSDDLSATLEHQETSSNSQLEVRLRPFLKIKRLWAPHQGHIRIPKPPKIIAHNCRDPKFRNLSSGPPELLDPSRVVPKNLAQQHGRDFIPNVCLKPVSVTCTPVSGVQHQISRSLPSVPSKEDNEPSIVEKRLSEAGLFTSSDFPSGRLSRPIIRRSVVTSSTDSSLFRHSSSQGLNSIDSSPAGVRHCSSIHDSMGPSLSSLMNPHKFSVSEERLRSDVRFAHCSSRNSLSRTTSDPEVNLLKTLVGGKRGRTSSWSSTPHSSSISPSRRKQFASQMANRNNYTIKSVGCTRHQHIHEPSQQKLTEPSTEHLPKEITPEMLMNLVADANPRITNQASTWLSMLERIEQFCNSVAPTDVDAKRHFDTEHQKLLMDLNSLQEKNFAFIFAMLKDNQRLWKLLTDALLLICTSPPLTPNTLAPSYGVMNIDQITRIISLFQEYTSRTSTEDFCQSAPVEAAGFQKTDCSRLIGPQSLGNRLSGTPEVSFSKPPDVRKKSPQEPPSISESSAMATHCFLLPSKRQRTFHNSYPVYNNNFDA